MLHIIQSAFICPNNTRRMPCEVFRRTIMERKKLKNIVLTNKKIICIFVYKIEYIHFQNKKKIGVENS